MEARRLIWVTGSVMTDMSPILIGINVVTGLVEVLILGVVIAVIYGTGG